MDVLFKNETDFGAVCEHNSNKMVVVGTLTTSTGFEIKVNHNGDYIRNVLIKNYDNPESALDTVLYTIEPNKVTSIYGFLLVP